MAWHVQIVTSGSTDYFIRGFSDHIYIYEEEALSGHRTLYFGSQHIDELNDPIRALYRAKHLISIFSSIQRLSNHNVWKYQDHEIFYTDFFNTQNNRRYDSGLTDQTIELEEILNPFGEKAISRFTYNNKYNHYMKLAQDDHLVYVVLELLNEAYGDIRYFYINLYKIIETIKFNWGVESINNYSLKSKEAYKFLTDKKLMGYMNQFQASGRYSRHGAKSSSVPHPNIISPPAIELTESNLLVLINGWLNYKINPEKNTFKL